MKNLYIPFICLIVSCGKIDHLPFFEDGAPQAQVVTPENANAKSDEFVTNEYMVAFRLEDQSSHLLSDFTENASFRLTRLKTNKFLYKNFVESGEVKDIEFISMVNMVKPEQKKSSIFDKLINLGLPAKTFNFESSLAHISLVKFSSDENAKQTLKKWSAENKIWFAEPNWKSNLSNTPQELFTAWQNNYSEAANNAATYYIKNTNIDRALAAIGSSNSIDSLFANPPVIAIFDSGIDVEHPNLKDKMVRSSDNSNSRSLCAQNSSTNAIGCNTSTDFQKGVLGDGNFFPALTSQFSQVCPTDKKGLPENICVHGTHVAGIAAASPDDTGKFLSFCPYCKLLNVRVVKEKIDLVTGAKTSGGITDSSLIRGMQYISNLIDSSGQRVVRVANFSLGKYQKSRSVALLARLLSESDSGRGILLIGAASNEDAMSRSYPAALPDFLAVAALDPDNQKSVFSNSGTWVDIAAPGDKITNTYPGGGGDEKSGTSMAAPVVAGVAALYFSLYPTATPEFVRNALIRSSDFSIYGSGQNKTSYYPVLSNGVNTPLLGAGIVNAEDLVLGNLREVPKPSERVVSGCGALGQKTTEKNGSSALAILLLFAPLLWIFIKRQTRSAS